MPFFLGSHLLSRLALTGAQSSGREIEATNITVAIELRMYMSLQSHPPLFSAEGLLVDEIQPTELRLLYAK
jgi:hypothetical protein